MKLRVYAIRDKAVEAFHPPMLFRSAGEATRAFVDAVNSTPQLGSHKEDFAFFFLGFFDDNAGLYEMSESGPYLVMNAFEVGKLDVDRSE